MIDTSSWGGIYSCSMLVVAKEVPATLFGQGRNSQSCCDWISLLGRFINGATWGSWHKCLEREIYLAPSICLSYSTLSGASKDLYLVLCKDFLTQLLSGLKLMPTDMTMGKIWWKTTKNQTMMCSVAERRTMTKLLQWSLELSIEASLLDFGSLFEGSWLFIAWIKNIKGIPTDDNPSRHANETRNIGITSNTD